MSKPFPKPSIVEVFEHYGSTVLNGGQWRKASCVLHEDRTPSASLNDDECRWRCFSCGESGDAVDLIAKVENVRSTDAKQIAEGFLAGSSGSVQPADHQSSSLLPSGKGHRPGRRQWKPSWRSL